MGGEPGVTQLHELRRIGIARIQAFEQRFRHVEGLVLPNPVGDLEILLGVRFGQVGARGGREATGHSLKLHVGQLVVVQGLVPSPCLRFGGTGHGACAIGELTVLGGFALGQFGVDSRLVDRVDGAQRVDDGPAEVVVDFQTVECHGTVEQALRVGNERLVARLAVAQVGGDELELFVGAGLGLTRQLEQFGGHMLHDLGTLCRSGVMPCGGADLCQRVTEGGGLVFGGERGQRGVDELACRQFAVAGHVPQGEPDHGTGERVVEAVQVACRECEALVVETQLRVGQVVVIHQNQRRTCLARGRVDDRQFAVDVQFETVGAHDLAGFRILVVEADGETVGAQHGMLGRSGLAQGETLDGAVLVLFDFGGDGVDAGFLKPLGAPRLQVAAGSEFQFGEQVGEGGVGVGVLVEVVVDALEELLTAHVVHELLQHGGALGVGDAVEVDVGVVEVVDRGDDRVGGAQLVLIQRPALFAGAEGCPGVLPFGGFGGGEGGRELGEGFVEPQVVPPLHGHVVAEPHVGELVQHGDDASFRIGVGDLGFEHVLVADGDHADVLHGAGVVFRHVDLVELGVRVRHAPGLGVEGEAFLGDVEQVVDVLAEGLGERLAAVHGHRHGAAVLIGVFGVPFGVRSGADGGEVGAHGRGQLEHPQLGGFGGVIAERAFLGDGFVVGHGGGGHVGRDDPGFGCEHGEVEHGLQIRLVEHGVDTAGVRHFELGVQVDVAVGRVDAAVQAFAGVGVLAHRLDGNLVVLLEALQLDAAVHVRFSRVEGFTVEGDFADFVGDEVKEA